MYFYTAWFVLRDSTSESRQDVLQRGIATIQDEMKNHLSSFVPNNAINDVNGEFLLQCSGSHNRPGNLHTSLLRLVRVIGDVLPGSYGLVYWTDDESVDTSDGYNVVVLARGTVRTERDSFLSPIVPNIED